MTNIVIPLVEQPLHRSEDTARYIHVKSYWGKASSAHSIRLGLSTYPYDARRASSSCGAGLAFLPGNGGAARGGGGVAHLLRELALGGYEVADDLALGCE
jgi:hypothetical protein